VFRGYPLISGGLAMITCQLSLSVSSAPVVSPCDAAGKGCADNSQHKHLCHAQQARPSGHLPRYQRAHRAQPALEVRRRSHDCHLNGT